MDHDSRVIFLLSVTFSFFVCSAAQFDFLSTLLRSSPGCNGTVEDISGKHESECVINETGGPDSWQVVKYTWKTGASKDVTDAQCFCGYDLVILLNSGSMPDSLCDENSPISCTKFCEPDQESAVCSNDTICDQDQNCIVQAIINHTSVYVFINGLGCAVLKSYTQDICRVLFQPAITNSPTDDVDETGPIALGVGLALGIIVTTVLVAVVGCFWCAFRRMRSRGSRDKVTHATNKNFNSNGTVLSLEEEVELTTLRNQRYKDMFGNILTSSKNIHIIDELGEGAFCKVHRGVMVSEEGGYHVENHVAIKHLKVTSSAEDVEEFISESAIMLEFDHPNVLRLLGVCFDTEDHLPLIVLPLMSNGDLKSFLIRKRGDDDVNVLPQNLAVYQLLSMCLDIAKGMEYLAKLKYIHRDLAARNCMIDDQLLVKVADFGFSRDVYATQYYRLGHKTRLPVKWMPPESLLDNIYNEKSDIWSYGVTCWEVFSLGRGPYPGVDNAEIPEYISNGSRLKQPVLCSDDMYSIMLNCWFLKPSERPKFSAVVGYVSQCLESEASPDKLDQQEIHDCNRPYFVLDVKKTPMA